MRKPGSESSNTKIRPTLFDSLNSERNIYCRREDLSNEASVEEFFISRLLKDLGFRDSQIKPKQSLSLLTVSRGRRKERYKPDYALVVKKIPRCIVDAKSTTEDIEDWIEQCSGYCLALNRKYPDTNPARYFVLSNGLKTNVYRWDSDEPLVSLDFSDFEWSNPRYQNLRAILSSTAVADDNAKYVESHEQFELVKATSEKARQLFSACHDKIWKSEGCAPTAAFMDFVKIMFVKLWADRKLRRDEATSKCFQNGKLKAILPKNSVLFSEHWLTAREQEGTVNPLDSILFQRLRDEIEHEIQLKRKKRSFSRDERINLKPETIKSVVRKLEKWDLFGIDEDLNGRLFETFLSATMRGEGLGQYFTPRSIVKMMTLISGIKVNARQQSKVLDACCGSGGFLIESLAVMRNQVRSNRSLSADQKEKLLDVIANECIFGIDFGKEPPLARIARINMYLHGDGGSRIYYADSLDKDLKPTPSQDPEVARDQTEIREFLQNEMFDIVLTNPPFSMTKEQKNDDERRILERYTLARKEGTARIRPSLRSSVMFIERYFDVLRPGGLLIIVLDDSLLASNIDTFRDTRNFIRKRFLIRAIISLPGDAFRRQGSRVKTSVLVLEKKKRTSDIQPDCYGYFALKLGLDDLTPRASDADIAEARSEADAEIHKIVDEFKAFLDGNDVPLTISPDRLQDRLDLKNCVPEIGRMVPAWKKMGVEIKRLADVVVRKENVVIPKDKQDENFTLLRVTYEGRCEIDSVRLGSRIKAAWMNRVHAGDLVFSTIRATDGSIGVVPENLDGALVSGSYTVFRCSTIEDTVYLWAILRSSELRADMQSMSPGSGRYTTYWPEIGELLIPWMPETKRQEIGRGFLQAWREETRIALEREDLLQKIAHLGVESEDSKQRFRASKAPT